MGEGKGKTDAAKRDMERLRTISKDVEERTKIQIDMVIDQFLADHRVSDFTFPATLTNIERAYVHHRAHVLGFSSCSKGNGAKRCVTISKIKTNNAPLECPMSLTDDSFRAIAKYFEQVRNFSEKEETEVDDDRVNVWKFFDLEKEDGLPYINPVPAIAAQHGLANRLHSVLKPLIPKKKRSYDFDGYRRSLPIWRHKNSVLRKISRKQITIIKGDTGCGKTTQVPQFILDEAIEQRRPIRMYCTVPRRIAAVSVSERVSLERGEKVGHSVGFQIRLESCFSPQETCLIYCTSGILLRSLTSFDYSILKNTTHIVIDEIHERDRQTDFLVACLRDVLPHFPHLKLIVMGADMDVGEVTSYFKIPIEDVLEIEGRLHNVKVCFLDEVLSMTNFRGNACNTKNSKSARKTKESPIFKNLVHSMSGNETADKFSSHSANFPFPGNPQTTGNQTIDHCIQQFWTSGCEKSFEYVLNAIASGEIGVDYHHTTDNVTMMMAAAARGSLKSIRALLKYNPDLACGFPPKGENKPFTPMDWAVSMGEFDVVSLLAEEELSREFNQQTVLRDLGTSNTNNDLVKQYFQKRDDERVDLNLIDELLVKIHTTTPLCEAVLVFLPGYEEIVTLNQMIFSDGRISKYCNSLVVFLLHSNIQTGDQRAVFSKVKKRCRKVVLSTNIAETSLTIEDIVHVVDAGKVKEKTFDAMTGVTQLKSNWISKASANQRKGRAGRCRPGVCYRLYTQERYSSFTNFAVPEILRTSLQELCLYARGFIRKEARIQDFFQQLPEAPAPIAVKMAVEWLKSSGALDADEQLTQLGVYLLDLPIDPWLGKALIYAVVLKCLDPILTLISIMSYRDPFQLPSDPTLKTDAIQKKLLFARRSFSDHMAGLRVFQDWEKAKQFSPEQKEFCKRNFVSSACFEMVYGIRSQLLSQLRAMGFVQTLGTSDLKCLNTNSSNWSIVKAVLTATLYPNVCYVDRLKKSLVNEFDKKISFHVSSVVPRVEKNFSDIPANWIIFDEMNQIPSGKSVRNCTSISDITLAVFGGNFSELPKIKLEDDVQVISDVLLRTQDRTAYEVGSFILNDWISIRGKLVDLRFVIWLRRKFMELVGRKLKDPTCIYSKNDEILVETLKNVLAHEDNSLRLEEVCGIGQWPKFVAGNMMSQPTLGYECGSVVTGDLDITSESDSQEN